MKKGDLNARVRKAAESGAVEDRFARAEQVVIERPTGFSAPPETGKAVPAPAATPGFTSTFTRESTSLDGRRIYYSEEPLERIDPNPFNARVIYRPERINELSVSMKASGQMVPGIATIRDGRVILAAGHYRLKGLKLGGLPRMKLMIHEGLTDRELYEISFKENEERTDQSPVDNALVWKQLLKDGVYKNETEIAEATGYSLSNVNKIMSVHRLSEPVLEQIKAMPEMFKLSVLYELVLLEKAAGEDGQDLVLEMVKKIIADEAGRKEIAEVRARLENPRERKPKENSRQYKISAEGRDLGFIKDWDSGKVALEVLIDDPKEREALVHLLKQRFKLAE